MALAPVPRTGEEPPAKADAVAATATATATATDGDAPAQSRGGRRRRKSARTVRRALARVPAPGRGTAAGREAAADKGAGGEGAVAGRAALPRVRPGAFGPVRVRRPGPPIASSPAKRAVDLLGGVLLLLGLAVPLLAIAAAIAVSSPGPVLVRRERAGLGGRPFAMLVFRTAPATRVGRLLRAHYLDHLPQLIHVVRGEMSLVGPRPPTPAGAAAATGPARAVRAVRPGITGPWQIGGGRPGPPWEERAVLDPHYVAEHWLGLDLMILARTLPAVLRGRTPARGGEGTPP
ncbi:sugar transferase [Streptomyces sp. NPDC014894]|uniref:sugar transferase n=1 Tax=Streptomyces sp. NPDC014894 TaxID=3364931 RepID=UPI0036F86EA0